MTNYGRGKPRVIRGARAHASLESLAVDGFGHWLAGFADGEGHFFLTRSNGGTFRCQFSIQLRADDAPILHEIAERTGVGYVTDPSARNHQNQMVKWMVVRKADVARIVDVFSSFPLRAKKRKDFEVWARAVRLFLEVRHVVDMADRHRLGNQGGTSRHPNQERLAQLKVELADVRRMPCTH